VKYLETFWLTLANCRFFAPLWTNDKVWDKHRSWRRHTRPRTTSASSCSGLTEARRREYDEDESNNGLHQRQTLQQQNDNHFMATYPGIMDELVPESRWQEHDVGAWCYIVKSPGESQLHGDHKSARPPRWVANWRTGQCWHLPTMIKILPYLWFSTERIRLTESSTAMIRLDVNSSGLPSPPSTPPTTAQWRPFLKHPSQYILAWDRHWAILVCIPHNTEPSSIISKRNHYLNKIRHFYLDVSVSTRDLHQKKLVQFFFRFLPQ